ncbi:glutamyl-tRNA amidotransferase subunit A [Sarocladium strictum]
MDSYKLTATDLQAKFKADELTVTQYAESLIGRVKERNPTVKAWAHFNPELVLEQAKALDEVPKDKRGPLHGVAIGVKDVIYTKDMPTAHNSSIYEGSFPKIDAASIQILRQAGALIFGKTTTTEFAATVAGPATTNAHSPNRTPGGSSSGSGAAVGDMQVPIGLGTQTGGSTIRPGSFNGIYALKPTWGAISREGQKLYSLIFDVLGLYARSAADLDLLAEVFDLQDDEASPFSGLEGAKFAICKTPMWSEVGEGTKNAMEKGAALLSAHGATVEEITLPPVFDNVTPWHKIVLGSDGHPAFLADYRTSKDQLSPFLQGHVERAGGWTRKQQLEAFDGIARLRPEMDDILGQWDAIIVPSVPDEAPEGLDSTGSPVFNSMWTAMHTPVMNVPGFKGANNMPIGLSLVAPRYHDRHLLKVSRAVGEVFEAEGGWKSSE